MEQARVFTRRTPRYDIAPGRGCVLFTDPRDSVDLPRAALRKLSIRGMAFETRDNEWPHPTNAIIPAEIVVGQCRLAGEFVVRDVYSVDERTQVGGLFHPASEEAELVLTGLITGIEVTAAPAPGEAIAGRLT